MSELSGLLQIALRAAALAGETIMPLYGSPFEVERKADRTPVTEADRRAELVMRDFFARETPAFGVLGEEFGETPGDGRHRWIIDPIDGTKSFIHRVPLFGTLVALERDGEPVVGVIACHALGETVAAASGLGAHLNGVPCRTSDVDRLEEATLTMTSFARTAAHRPLGYRGLVERCGLARAWGDCFGYLLVATGRAEIMLDPEMSVWDAAALQPVIREAGGGFSQWDGNRALGDSAVATNGRLHAEVIRILAADLS
jgi:histidinol phosphatase-like enzyme (inositol monophosphatase family)